jgi:hypothetical protein
MLTTVDVRRAPDKRAFLPAIVNDHQPLRFARLRPRRQPEPLPSDPYEPYRRLSAHERLVEAAALWAAEQGRQPRRRRTDPDAAAEQAFVDAAFSALPSTVQAEQKLLGMLMLRPALHSTMRVKPRDFSDRCHREICFFAWTLWRLKQPASANGVAGCLWWLTPLLEAGDKPSAIERLVFETLGWRFDEYIFDLEERADELH